MKRIIFTLTVTLFMAGSALTSFAQHSHTTEEAKRDSVAEYKKFRKECDEKIANNKKKIAELKTKKSNESKEVKEKYNKKVADLEQKNEALNKKAAAYDANNNGWTSFKREFNHDMDEIGSALKDLTVDNKK